MNYKKLTLIIVTFLSILSLAACSINEGDDDNNYEIVATSYIAYDMAVNIVGSNNNIKLLITPGADLHHYSPTSNDMKIINNAKLLIYTSDRLEPWASNIKINKMNLSDETELINDLFDKTHFWTNTLVYLDLLESVYLKLLSLYDDNILELDINYNNYLLEITNIHLDLLSYTSNLDSSNNKLYLYGHNAMRNFEELYNLEIIPISSSSSSSAEFTPKEIELLITQLEEGNAKYLFIEELADLTKANSLLNSLSSKGYEIGLLELHGYHNISINDYNQGVTYGQLLMRNANNIKNATNN